MGLRGLVEVATGGAGGAMLASGSAVCKTWEKT